MPEASQRTGEWFEAFYERNYRLVYRLCFTYMKNRAEAEECTEDVFFKVLTGDFTFNDEAHEKKWLTVTAINLCKDLMAKAGHADRRSARDSRRECRSHGLDP